MFTPRSSLGLAASLIFIATTAHAVPIQYKFSGALNQPYNGASAFTGTLVYDTDLPLYPGIQSTPGNYHYQGKKSYDAAPDVYVTVELGDAKFGVIADSQAMVWRSAAASGFSLDQRYRFQDGPILSLHVGFYHENANGPDPLTSDKPPLSLSLDSFIGSIVIYIRDADGGARPYNGSLTSLTLADGPPPPPLSASDYDAQPVPEPASLIVFAAAFIGSVRRLYLKTRLG